MTHAELVAAAVKWLRGSQRCPIAFAEISTAAGVIPDAIGWRWGQSVVVECKTSRADFRRDADKPHIQSQHPIGRKRWYFTPAGLLRVDEIPACWGLVEWSGKRATIRRDSPINEDNDWRAESLILMSAIRRHQIGVPFDLDTGRFQTLAARAASVLGSEG